MKPLNQPMETIDHDVLSAHRDDVYLLFILHEGYCRAHIDFEELVFTGPSCCLIHPEQVHALIEYGIPEGWMLAFDPGLLTPETTQLAQPLALLTIPNEQAHMLAHMQALTNLIWTVFSTSETTEYKNLTLQHLLNALIACLASAYQSSRPTPSQPENRSDEITAAFRQLLKTHYIGWKRPAQYAQALRLSVNHLNDTVKQKTGSPVSYWIQYQTMLEARRLLYHTQQSVKEVAFRLGFEDQHYFSRLFRKVTGQTPVRFRRSYRDSSTKSPV